MYASIYTENCSQTQSTHSQQSQHKTPRLSSSQPHHHKSKTKRKKKKSINNNDDSNASRDNVMDYSQDSDAENSKVQKFKKNKLTQFDNILDYFEAPFHAKENDTVCICFSLVENQYGCNH
jgi:hypothetical protein